MIDIGGVSLDKLLYFPTIEIPKSQWLMRTLFYWDKVGSIVPLDYLNNPNRLNPYMRELVHEGLIEQVVPEDYIGGIPNFESGFLNHIESDSVINSISNLGKLGLIGQDGVINSISKIHIGKLSYLGEELIRRGLATQRKGAWYFVESYTASKFMAYLASVIGALTEYTPITDSYKQMSHYIAPNEKQDVRKELKEQIKARIVEKILPVPSSIDDPYDLFRFREKYYDELKRFRNHIEEFVLTLETLQENQIEDKIKLFTEQSEDQIKFILDKMGSFKWINIDLATLCTITASTTAVVKGVADSSNIETVGAAVGLLGAVATVLNHNKDLNINRKPLAYAAFVEKEFNRGTRRGSIRTRI